MDRRPLGGHGDCIARYILFATPAMAEPTALLSVRSIRQEKIVGPRRNADPSDRIGQDA